MIRLTFTANSDERVVAALRTKGPKLQRALAVTLDELMVELVKRIQRKLSGEVLKQRSGKLLGSVELHKAETAADQIKASVTAAGNVAFYGAIQEKGGLREYPIVPRTKKALAFFPGGSEGGGVGRLLGLRLYFKTGKRRGTLRPTKYGEFAELGGVVVKSVKHPPLPARSFMRSSLEEMRAEIVSKLFKSAAEALK